MVEMARGWKSKRLKLWKYEIAVVDIAAFKMAKDEMTWHLGILG